MKNIFIALLTLLVLLIAGCGSSKKTTEIKPIQGPKYLSTPSGLKYIDVIEGSGAIPKYGQKVTVDLIGNVKDGKVFEDTYKSKTPVEFEIGEGLAIKGLEEGVLTMHVGGKRKLLVPPDLGFGMRGVGEIIPPNSTLIMEVELVKIH